ncbi:MAG: hypothetical protein Ct9H300mP12_15090 [Acidimicrobiales bacterium]|nr:MAG: hypothetical protein Ct9H300mP12_15090 [Acidimicrobiales bacterium]
MAGLNERVARAPKAGTHGLIGKYVSLVDAYLSVVEALNQLPSTRGLSRYRLDSGRRCGGLLGENRLRDLDGIVIPGGFGERGVEGKFAAAGLLGRTSAVPWPLSRVQCMTIEFARNVLGLERAHSSEFDPSSPHPLIDLMESQRDVSDKGGTMRLGAYVAQFSRGHGI